MKRIMRLALFVLILAVAASHAQQTTGALAGCVTDPDGKPLIGATVRILTTIMGGITKAPDGRYFVRGIRPGEYEVTISALGYRPVTRHVVVAPGQTSLLDAQFMEWIKQPPGCRFYPVIDPERVGTVYTITSQELERMP
jgi:hypothetical protein